MPRRLWWVLVLVGAAVLAAAGCHDDAPATATTTPKGAEPVAGELRVLAAASLTEVFTEIGRAVEAAHPGLRVTFSFAGSSALAQQIEAGAPADVFVSADEATMEGVVAAGDATDPQRIARNRLALLVERGNPKGIGGLGDLDRPGIVFVLCAPEVPCGRFGAAALTQAGVAAKPASLEANVKAVVAKVRLGEVDAGIVYATDVAAAGEATEGIDIAGADDPALEAVYLAAVTSGSANPTAAARWTEHLLSAEGQAVLARYGFLAP
ncbi:MAG TPA: molybdate ABC transporter substrate-binding protein [Acidimicrobiales bacterium]|nr:molybdate ABC transporter substrate-binding protein [Acidimicrobiales bacterium]